MAITTSQLPGSWVDLSDPIDFVQSKIITTKKMIWDNHVNDFVPRSIHRILVPDLDKQVQWCRELYGEPKINQTWWSLRDGKSLCLMDNIFTFWALKNNLNT